MSEVVYSRARPAAAGSSGGQVDANRTPQRTIQSHHVSLSPSAAEASNAPAAAPAAASASAAALGGSVRRLPSVSRPLVRANPNIAAGRAQPAAASGPQTNAAAPRPRPSEAPLGRTTPQRQTPSLRQSSTRAGLGGTANAPATDANARSSVTGGTAAVAGALSARPGSRQAGSALSEPLRPQSPRMRFGSTTQGRAGAVVSSPSTSSLAASLGRAAPGAARASAAEAGRPLLRQSRQSLMPRSRILGDGAAAPAATAAAGRTGATGAAASRTGTTTAAAAAAPAASTPRAAASLADSGRAPTPTRPARSSSVLQPTGARPPSSLRLPSLDRSSSVLSPTSQPVAHALSGPLLSPTSPSSPGKCRPEAQRSWAGVAFCLTLSHDFRQPELLAQAFGSLSHPLA